LRKKFLSELKTLSLSSFAPFDTAASPPTQKPGYPESFDTPVTPATQETGYPEAYQGSVAREARVEGHRGEKKWGLIGAVERLQP
jgi:hypothetical protein